MRGSAWPGGTAGVCREESGANENTDPGRCFSLQVSGGRTSAGAAREARGQGAAGRAGVAAALPRPQGSARKASEARTGAGARGRRIREEGGLRAWTVLAPPCCQRRRAGRIWRDEQGCWGRDPGSSSGTGCLWLPVIPASSRHPEPGTRHHGAPTLPHRPRPRQRQRRQGGRCPLQRGPHFRTQRSGRAGLCRCGEGGGPSLPFSGSLRCASVPFSSNLLDSFIQAMGRSLVPDVGTR